MKRLLWILILASGLSRAQSPIMAGAFRTNITPPIGTVINGDFLPIFSKSVHDSLFAKALAISNGKEKFVFVVVDNMTLDGPLIENIKFVIQKKTGLPPTHVMVSATHAHSCGSVVETATCFVDLAYRLSLPVKVANAVAGSLKNLRPAKIAWGNAIVPTHVSCRRWFMKPGFEIKNPFGETEKVWMNPPFGSPYLDRPVSPTDPEMVYMAVKGLDDKWISVMANYSTHYVADAAPNTFSADYFGYFDKYLGEKLGAGKDFVGIMSNGTSGDVNTFDFRQEKNYPKGYFEKSELIANELTDSVMVKLASLKWETKPMFKSVFGTQKIEKRRPSAALLERSKKMVLDTDFGSLNTTDKASNAMASLYAYEIVKTAEYEGEPVDAPLQAIRLGAGTIGTLPGEIFSETGLKLKGLKPTPFYFTVCLANAQIGYVPPATQHALGGYETWLCSGSNTEINAEEKLRVALGKLIVKVQR